MLSRHPNRRRKSSSLPLRRRGYLTMELVLTLPILLLVLLALLEFSILFFARGQVVECCRKAARKGTLPNASRELVEEEVRRVLSPSLQRGAQVEFVPGEQAGDPVLVAVRVPMSMAAPDLLWPVGFSLRGRMLNAELVMIKE